jgi:8-oxo-dGTP pyrophosphatase MutT (NUDIX family)
MATPDFILRLREKVGREPLWLSGATAVVVRPGKDGDEVLLEQRADDGEWSPVAGIIDPGEQPHHAALREVAEEAGVTARIERLAWLTVTGMVTYGNGDQTQYIDHVFRCAWVSGDPEPVDGEAVAAGFFCVDALPPMTTHHLQRVRVALEDATHTRLGPLG